MQPEIYDLVTTTPNNPRSGEGDMVVLHDGRLLFAYGHFTGQSDDARASIVKRYSADDGRTWTEPEVLIPADEAKQNVMSVSLLRLQSGGILLFYLRKDGPERCQAWVRRSDDEGETWGEAVCCTPDEEYHVIVNNCALQLEEGRILLPYEVCPRVWVQEEHIEAGIAYSDDEGLTWGHSNRVYTKKRGAMEARIIEARDHRLRMYARTDQGEIYVADVSGRGERVGGFVSSGIESPQSPFALTRIPNTGDWLLIWNPVADLSAGSHQGFRTPLRCAISTDDGQTWRHAKDLEPDTERSYCYVSVTFTAQTAVLSYYIGSRELSLEGLRIARVPIEWFYED
ncbi:MAG: sialidase family protein [Armatimonadia bacterium]